ncbi:MAG: hypothetical protein IJZ90_01430 [Clostridia bacterium]|nr:hypothetical protein [Clostridia bacterium]
MHKIQGIGACFIPETLNTEFYDEVIAVEIEEAYVAGKAVPRQEGILIGVSAAAAVGAAAKPAYLKKTDRKL